MEQNPELNKDELLLEVDRLIGRWKDVEGNLIMILHEIQNEHGYVPREVSLILSQQLHVPLARIYEVITFYHYFKLTPPGKHNVAVCNGTACYLKGAPHLLSAIETHLGVKEGETTPDREFHVETVRCIGCCGLAPAVVVDHKTFGKVRTSSVPEILENTRKGANVA